MVQQISKKHWLAYLTLDERIHYGKLRKSLDKHDSASQLELLVKLTAYTKLAVFRKRNRTCQEFFLTKN